MRKWERFPRYVPHVSSGENDVAYRTPRYLSAVTGTQFCGCAEFDCETACVAAAKLDAFKC